MTGNIYAVCQKQCVHGVDSTDTHTCTEGGKDNRDSPSTLLSLVDALPGQSPFWLPFSTHISQLFLFPSPGHHPVPCRASCQLGWVAREDPLASLQYRFVNMCCHAWLFMEVLEIETSLSFLGGKCVYQLSYLSRAPNISVLAAHFCPLTS